jgi:hypothetical protein
MTSDQLSFKDLIDLVSRELSRQTLNNSAKLTKKLGLSKLSMEDISKD